MMGSACVNLEMDMRGGSLGQNELMGGEKSLLKESRGISDV